MRRQLRLGSTHSLKHKIESCLDVRCSGGGWDRIIRPSRMLVSCHASHHIATTPTPAHARLFPSPRSVPTPYIPDSQVQEPWQGCTTHPHGGSSSSSLYHLHPLDTQSMRIPPQARLRPRIASYDACMDVYLACRRHLVRDRRQGAQGTPSNGEAKAGADSREGVRLCTPSA